MRKFLLHIHDGLVLKLCFTGKHKENRFSSSILATIPKYMKAMLFSELAQNPICAPYAEKMEELLKSLKENFLLGRKDLSALADKMFANAEVYNSRAEGPYESHERYIDVQCVLEGTEEIELCPVGQLSVTEVYDPSRDIAFYDGKTPCTDKVVLHRGECCVICPGIGHKPCMDNGGQHFVKKVVFKIPV